MNSRLPQEAPARRPAAPTTARSHALPRSLAVQCLVAGLALCSLSGCSVVDYFTEATEAECKRAARHVVVVQGGENAALGAGVAELLFPGAVDTLLTAVADVCIAKATRHDTKCIMGASDRAELRECAFYAEHWGRSGG